jgi:hypothetical protein
VCMCVAAGVCPSVHVCDRSVSCVHVCDRFVSVWSPCSGALVLVVIFRDDAPPMKITGYFCDRRVVTKDTGSGGTAACQRPSEAGRASGMSHEWGQSQRGWRGVGEGVLTWLMAPLGASAGHRMLGSPGSLHGSLSWGPPGPHFTHGDHGALPDPRA